MDERCEAVLILHDDRWGALHDRCELETGHDGEHSVAYTATEPPAHMRWTDDAHARKAGEQ